MSGSTIGGVIGAAIGGYFTGSVQGAQIGWAIGSAIGGYIDPTIIKGPQLTDARTQTAQDGVALPFGYGTFPTAGNLIWWDKIVEHKSKKRQGKGGPVQVTYTYTRSYAIGICEGPIAGLLTIKRNGKVVYTVDPNALAADRAQGSKFLGKCTIYLGTETQMPDPTIEAVELVGNVSPFRGLAYVVIKDDDLTDLQGAVPQYEFVVSMVGTAGSGTVPGPVTLDPVQTGASSVLTADRMTVTGTGSSSDTVSRCTLGRSTGKYYFEVTVAKNGSPANEMDIGVANASTTGIFAGGLGGSNNGWALDAVNGSSYHAGNVYNTSSGFFTAATWTNVGDTVGVAVDLDAHTICFRVNGVWSADPALGQSNILATFLPWTGAVYPATYVTGSATTSAQQSLTINFGLTPFAYAPPGGYLPWNYKKDGVPIPDAPGWYQLPDGTVAGSFSTLNVLPTTVGTIAADLLQRSGLAATDYDVSLGTMTIDGYKCATEGGADAFLMPLLVAHFIDPGEWDAKFRLIPRGGINLASIGVIDLAQRNGPAIEQTRVQEAELLRKVNVGYLDPAGGYTPVVQTEERRAGTISAKGESSIEVPMVLSATKAKQIADKRLKVAWAETEKFKFSLASKWDSLTATDVVLLTDKKSVTHRVRIMGLQDDSGVRMVEAVKDRQSSYTSNVVGVTPTPPPSTAPGLIGATNLQVMNLPVWSGDAADDVGLYVAMGGVLSGWHGAALSASTDAGVNYNVIAQTILSATIGLTTTALTADVADTPSTQSLIVTLPDAPASVDYPTLLRYANRMAMQLDSGAWEILQYQTVVANGGNSYTLSGLVRGRYATTPGAASAGAVVVLLDEAVQFVPIDRAMIGQTFTLKPVAYGLSIDAITATTFAFTAAQSQIEWPVHSVAASRDGSNNITTTFVGEARLGTSLQPHNSQFFTGYRISYTNGGTTKIFDVPGSTGAGPTVSTPVPAHVYSAAQQTTDFGGIVTLTVTVAALNQITGAGPASAGITV